MMGIMALMVANKAFFLHSHQMANGTVIAHAHPYDKSNDPAPQKSHRHTQTELIFIDNLKLLFSFLVLFLAYSCSPLTIKHSVDLPFLYLPACICIHKGRAPPLS